MKKIIRSSILALLLTIAIQNPVHAARMSLSPGSGEFINGCSYPINLIVDTEGNNSLAADAVLTYNPNEIEIIGGIRSGHAYEAYPGSQVGGGTIRLTAFNRSGFFNGRGVLGVINFKGKPGVTSSNISYQFSPGSSVDSNIANADSLDILTSVGNANLSFKEGSCPRAAAPPKPSSPPGENEVEEVAETSDLAGELEACKNALLVLEDLERKDTGETEFLCDEIGKLKPSADYQSRFRGFWSLMLLLILSLGLNIALLSRIMPMKMGKHGFEKRAIKPKRRRK